MRSILGVLILLLAACSGTTLATRVEIPNPPPKAMELPPNPPSRTDDQATQRWLDREVARMRGVPDREGAAAAEPTSPPEQEPRTSGDFDDEVAATPPLQPRADQRAARTDEDATRAWLDQTIEERRAANPNTPPVPLQQIVERTVYVDRYQDGYRPYYYGVGYDEWGYPRYEPYYDSYYWNGRRTSTFPLNTAVGAGVGAIIGNQSGNRDKGAAIGAGIGLLMDFWR